MENNMSDAFIQMLRRTIGIVRRSCVLLSTDKRVLANEGKGLGRALLTEILKNAGLPIYLHTQPTPARAIKLYSDFGFKLTTDPIIGYP